MTEEKLIGTISLENDLLISFYDESRKIAADTWQIVLSARIQILTDQVLFTRVDVEKKSEIIQAIGKQINYEKKLIRIFINENKKEEIFKELYESFLQNSRPYLSHRQFA